MTRRNRIPIFRMAAIALLAIGTVPQTKADAASMTAGSPIDVAEGDRLAHTLCVNCHVVDNKTPLVRTDRVPSFSWIAQQPGLTTEFVTGWLTTSQSHERMPDLNLSRDEIRQLTAYIYSLRKQ